MLCLQQRVINTVFSAFSAILLTCIFFSFWSIIKKLQFTRMLLLYTFNNLFCKGSNQACCLAFMPHDKCRHKRVLPTNVVFSNICQTDNPCHVLIDYLVIWLMNKLINRIYCHIIMLSWIIAKKSSQVKVKKIWFIITNLRINFFLSNM